jgi:hypothetical protein
VNFELLRNLVDRRHTTHGLQCHLGLEIGTVNLAFLTFCHATVLQNSSLNPCLKFVVHFNRNMATTQRYIDLRPGVLRNAVELV